MRARYCAFALKIPQYIIKTTHQENQDYNLNIKEWKKDILEFCNSCIFKKLELLEFEDRDTLITASESFVIFKATLSCDTKDNSFIEKSKFIKVNNIWLYHSGEFLYN